MRYGSVCSGIEAATVAWHPLGWQPSFFSEIEAFPRAVLAHHYPNVPLHGDFTTIKGSEYEPIDLLVGGTPCQSFSVAGLRGGLDDDRGNLALEFLRLADRTRPRWLVWENVPGVLSSNGGRDFGSILGGMGELGYGWAYRVLDAQYFGVAQRRRRVFVVGYLGDWRRAAAVLFERHSLQGNFAPRREKGKGTARAAEESPGASRSLRQPGALSHWDGPEHPHPTLNQSHNAGGVGQSNQEIFSQRGAYLAQIDVARTLSARHDGSPCADRGPNVVAVPQTAPTLTSNGDAHSGYRDEHGLVPVAPTLTAANNPSRSPQSSEVTQQVNAVYNSSMQVRRLTPRECERLQGFPDDYTLIPHRNKLAADGPRYKALGNSMAVPVMRWIGERIQMVEKLNIKSG